MAKVTAAMVKELRQASGAGMLECKKALVEADGDFDKAVDVLRMHGLAAVAKKAGRATNEGRVTALVSATDSKKGAIVQLNCETDFVALNEKFQDYCKTFTEAAIAIEPADIDSFKAAVYDGETIDARLTEAIHVIGENMQISTVQNIAVEGCGTLVSYIHMNGKIAVLVGFTFNDESTACDERFGELGHDIAMQIAATNPVSLDEKSVPVELRDHEMEIYKAQAAESGKPENIQEKIATGRMKKFYKQNCLLDQEFVKDCDITVGDYLTKVAKQIGDDIRISTFSRVALGD